MTRMQMLEDAMQMITQYTKTDNWRPGLIDLMVYNDLINMYESDVDDDSYVWLNTPDVVMEVIVESAHIFDVEYGWEDLDEQVRNYLIDNDFIIDIDDATEDQLTEWRNKNGK